MEADAESLISSFLRKLQPYSWSYQDITGQPPVRNWTPGLTFATPGNLSISYATQVGKAVKMGPVAILWFNIVTSAFTHTSASGSAQITGVPYKSVSTTSLNAAGSMFFGGITKANYTQFVPRFTPNTATMDFVGSGSGQSPVALAAGDFPTGGTVNLRGVIAYLAQ